MQHTLIVLIVMGSTLACCKPRSNAMSPQTGAAIHEQVDSIVVIKNKRLMELYNHRKLLTSYHVCLGPEPVGAKHFRNDGKTPEGLYYINGKNPNSHYHKCLGISYPSLADMRFAQSFGKPAGGDIKIHGLPHGEERREKEYTAGDWTLGCIALTNNQVDELYNHTSIGTPINIQP